MQRYKEYALGMKKKYEQFEIESEKYYSDLLDKFKAQAKQVMERKEQELEGIRQIKAVKEAKIERMRARKREKHFSGLLSDEEDSEISEPEELKLDMVEYNFLRAERNKTRLIIEQWVRQFKNQNKRVPKDSDTAAIAQEYVEYQDAEKKFLNFKVKMLEAQLLEFEPSELIIGAYDASQVERHEKI